MSVDIPLPVKLSGHAGESYSCAVFNVDIEGS